MTEPAPRKPFRFRLRLPGHHDGDEIAYRELSIVTLIAALVIGTAFLIAYRFVRPAPPDRFVISTGNTAGHFEWTSSDVVQWVPDGYWSPHSKISVDAHGMSTGFDTGDVLAGRASRPTRRPRRAHRDRGRR